MEPIPNDVHPLLAGPFSIPELERIVLRELHLQALWNLRQVSRHFRISVGEFLRALPQVIWLTEAVQTAGFIQMVPPEVYTMSMSDGKWRKIGRLPEPRRRLASCMMNDGRIALIGGENDSQLASAISLSFVNSSKVTATPLPSLRFRRSGVGAAVCSGGVFVCGGQWQNQEDGDVDDDVSSQGDWGFFDECWLLSPGARSWTPLPPLPGRERRNGLGGRHSLGCCALPDGRVLVAGGWSLGDGKNELSSEAHIFDPQQRTWTELAPMPGRGVFNACVLPGDERVLVMGSSWSAAWAEKAGHTAGRPTPVYAYNLRSQCWEVMAGLPIPTPAPHSLTWNSPVAILGHVFVSGYSVPGRRSWAEEQAAGRDVEEEYHHEMLCMLDHTQSKWKILKGGTAPIHNLSATPLAGPRP